MELDRVIGAAFDQCGDGWRAIFDAAPNVHLAFLREPYLQWILDAKKTIESRFSVHRCLPHGRVSKGDVVLLKRTGGPIVGAFSVARAESKFATPENPGWHGLRRYSSNICVDLAFWEAVARKPYSTLIWIDQVKDLGPIEVDKAKGDRRAWIILRDSTQPALGDIL